MTDDDLIRRLHTEEDRLPREAADAIIARGAAIVPRLAGIVARRDAWRAEDETWWAPIHATFLLGAIGGPDAIPPLLAALRFASAEDVDWVHEAMPDILAALGPPALDALRRIAQDASAETHLRLVACDALRELASRHPAQREAVADALRPVAGSRAADDDVRWSAGHFLLQLALPQDRALLETLATEQEKVRGGGWFDTRYVREVYAGPSPFKPVPNEPDWLAFYDPEAIRERQQRWAEEHVHGDDGEDDALDDYGEEGLTDEEEADPDGPPPPPLVNTESLPGRNDPCPCGSGKKFKKCCGKGG
jgi:hypothetical protein